jgi:multidrug resistance efflux pump
MIRTRRFLVFAVLLGIGAAVVTFLGAAKLSGTDSGDKSVAVKAGTPSGDSARGLICLGTVDRDLRAFGLFPKTFPQPSEVIEVLVKEGETVAKDKDLLKLNVVVDKTLADLTVEEAQFAVEEAKALLEQAKQAVQGHDTLIEIQKATVEAKEYALASKRVDLEDLKKAVKTGLRKQTEVDAAEKGIQALEKEVEAESKKFMGLQKVKPTTKVDQARAALERFKVKLKEAQHALEPMTLKAPRNGTILRSNVSVGTWLGPQTHDPVFLFQPESRLIVRAEVEQEFAHRVRPNLTAVISDYANAGLTWKGRVERVGDAFLPKRNHNGGGLEMLAGTNDTGVLECIVVVEPTKESPPLRLGQRVRISLGAE